MESEYDREREAHRDQGNEMAAAIIFSGIVVALSVMAGLLVHGVASWLGRITS